MSKWEIWKSNNLERDAQFIDVFNPNIKDVEKEVYEKRMDLCKSCEFLFKPTTQCKKCGCFMNLKAKLPHAKCPIGKW
jgi:hypothetical protein